MLGSGYAKVNEINSASKDTFYLVKYLNMPNILQHHPFNKVFGAYLNNFETTKLVTF